MRFLVKSLITVGLALGLSASASATVTVTLTQVGGTYSSVAGAVASDTLVLDIVVTLAGGDAVTSVDPAFNFSSVGGFVSGTEAAFNFVGGVLLTPIGVPGADIGILGSGAVGGWEATTLAATGAPGPATFSLGTATFHLNGAAGSISFAIGGGGETVIGGPNFANITGTSTLNGFVINGAVPEPTTVAMLGMGLLGLAVSGRRR
jgi:hypothetical protein